VISASEQGHSEESSLSRSGEAPVGAPTDLPGLDLRRLGEWLDDTLAVGLTSELTAEPLVGGRSNLTYLVGDSSRSWVVRRPPIGEVLATAHDVAREHRVLAALAGTAVPVPRTFGLCDDLAVLGAPFYVMEHVAGKTYRDASDLEPLGPQRTRAVSEHLVDTLAALHSVDARAVGLDTLGRPQGFLARQVRRWWAQLDASETPAIVLARDLHQRLEHRLPGDNRPGILHGDYRLDNVIVGHSDAVSAVIDWEMASCGDTLTDLALLVVYQRAARIAEGNVVPTASSAARGRSQHTERGRLTWTSHSIAPRKTWSAGCTGSWSRWFTRPSRPSSRRWRSSRTPGLGLTRLS
jgi:aminoglycoside phosphotransferase (APT) family kinase protein